jgi:hypothetical protein
VYSAFTLHTKRSFYIVILFLTVIMTSPFDIQAFAAGFIKNTESNAGTEGTDETHQPNIAAGQPKPTLGTDESQQTSIRTDQTKQSLPISTNTNDVQTDATNYGSAAGQSSDVAGEVQSPTSCNDTVVATSLMILHRSTDEGTTRNIMDTISTVSPAIIIDNLLVLTPLESKKLKDNYKEKETFHCDTKWGKKFESSEKERR